MSARIIQVHSDDICYEELEKLAEKHEVREYWCSTTSNERINFEYLVDGEHLQTLMDDVQSKLSSQKNARILLLPVEAFLPTAEESFEQFDPEKQKKKGEAEITREELMTKVYRDAALDRNYLLMVVFATLVSTIGLLENNVAVLVGAMVIAPFLGPNLAQTLAAALGDMKLVRKATRTNLIGSGIAFGIALIIGFIWPVSEDKLAYELKARAIVDYSSIVLALAAGAAAVLSLTKGVASVLVGVMVAVALLPPLTASALFLGMGYIDKSLGAMLLLLVNIVCINLSGLLTFMLRGIGPRTWWEKRKARTSVYWFVGGWSVALVLLSGVIGII